MTQLYKDGDRMGVRTDAPNAGVFIAEFCALLSDVIESGVYMNDWNFQLDYWLPQFADICCALRGHPDMAVRSSRLVRTLLTSGIFPCDATATHVKVLPMLEAAALREDPNVQSARRG